MSSERPQAPAAEASRAEAKHGHGASRRLQTGVRGLIVAVACCGVITWAARSVWETEHPAIAAARGLESPKPSDRTRAARELMQTGIKDPALATPPLIAALGDPAAEVRAAAAEALGVIACEAILAGSAGDVPRTATAGLIRSLKDREPAVRIAALGALKRIAGEKGAAGALDFKEVDAPLAAMLDDRDEAVRLIAVDALAWCGPLGSDDPPAALVAALEDRSAKIRAAAITALARFPRPLDPWLPRLLRALEHEEPEVRTACLVAFHRNPPPFSAAGIPTLVAALGSRARTARFHAARALERYARDPRVGAALVPALLALLRDPIGPEPIGASEWEPFITMSSIRMLGRIAPGTAWSGEVIAALAEVVRNGDPGRRRAAVEALGAFGAAAEPAIPALVRILREDLGTKDGSPYADGLWVARVLARIAPDTGRAAEAVAALTEALRSDRPDLRAAAVEALGSFGAAAGPTVPALILALREPRMKDEGLFYRSSVARLLGRIAPGTRSADAALAALTEALDSDPETRLGAIDGLSAFGPRAAGILPRLRVWQGDKDARLRTAAASALEAIEGAEAGHQEGDESKGPE